MVTPKIIEVIEAYDPRFSSFGGLPTLPQRPPLIVENDHRPIQHIVSFI